MVAQKQPADCYYDYSPQRGALPPGLHSQCEQVLVRYGLSNSGVGGGCLSRTRLE